MYAIVKAPNPVLITPAKKVTKVNQEIKNLIAEMTQTLESATDPEGVGLAAPQIGKPLQLFVVKESKNAPVLSYINPKIIRFTDTKPPKKPKHPTSSESKDDVKLEGCLSLQDVWGEVKRHDKVTLSYTDLDGKLQKNVFSGFLATIIQHECDHLNGILFPKRALEQNGTLYKSKKNEKGETIFEEIEI